MIKLDFILVSHGDLAKGMLASAQMIVRPQAQVAAFGLYPQEDVSTLRQQIVTYLQPLDANQIICFTDLFNGSPCNVVTSLMGQYNIRHLTGMNLALILEAFMMRQDPHNSREDLCHALLRQAPQTFVDINQFLDESKE